MFTIKAIRKDYQGRPRVHLYEALDVDVLRDAEGLKPGEAFVIFREPSGNQPAITVTSDEPEPDSCPCHTVYIENSAGKTTDVVKARVPRRK